MSNSLLKYFLILPFMISCSNQHDRNYVKSDTSKIKDDIAPISPDKSKTDNFITDRFLRLAHILDSCGYLNDSTRYKAIYKKPIGKSHLIDNYVFNEVKFNQTRPFEHISLCETDSSYHRQEWCKEWNLNIHDFKKVLTIVQYFYVDKNLNSKQYKGKRYFTDGIAEEWKFPDKVSAKRAAVELGRKNNMVYLNCAGLVCYVDQYMYVFYSRAINFMYSIRPVFNDFATEIKAIKTNDKI